MSVSNVLATYFAMSSGSGEISTPRLMRLMNAQIKPKTEECVLLGMERRSNYAASMRAQIMPIKPKWRNVRMRYRAKVKNYAGAQNMRKRKECATGMGQRSS